MRAILIKLFEPALFLRELIIDLPNVHSLQERVTIRGVGLPNVDKQVFAVLQWEEREEKRWKMRLASRRTLHCQKKSQS